MARVRFTSNLVRLFPALRDAEIPGATVAEAIRALEAAHPRLSTYLVDEHGALRTHVNIFIGDRRVRDRASLSDPLGEHDELFIVQALSGG
jgi:molybdopterin converting factor small subunit